MRIPLAAWLFPLASLAQPQVDANLVGRWETQVAGLPTKSVLRIESTGRCFVDDEAATCVGRAGTLVVRSPKGPSAIPTASRTAGC
jgi:hypothetical protein